MVNDMGMWGFWKRIKGKAEKTAQAEKSLTTAEGEDAFCFDREHYRPVIRASICTGEQVAGFKNLRTGRFTEIIMIRNNDDLEEFMRKYGLSKEEIRREW